MAGGSLLRQIISQNTVVAVTSRNADNNHSIWDCSHLGLPRVLHLALHKVVSCCRKRKDPADSFQSAMPQLV